MKNQALASRLRLVLTMLLAVGVTSTTLARPPECYHHFNDGCDIAANYDES